MKIGLRPLSVEEGMDVLELHERQRGFDERRDVRCLGMQEALEGALIKKRRFFFTKRRA